MPSGEVNRLVEDSRENANFRVFSDEPDSEAGGASHRYVVGAVYGEADFLQTIEFQRGVLSESGLNGIPDESLYHILIDRLRWFQSSRWACRENAITLTHLEEALMWQQKRTRDRKRRGVEGTKEL